MVDVYDSIAQREACDICTLSGKAWIPVRGFEQHLDTELAFQVHGATDRIQRFFPNEHDTTAAQMRLAYCENIWHEVFWKQLCLEEPFIVRFNTIGQAATLLRSIQRNWMHHPVRCFRRAELINKKLPYISKKEKAFPYPVPLNPMGVWSLLDEHTLLASAKTSSPFPCGRISFIEDHQRPPSRAYLKLWEALTLLDFYYRSSAASLETVPADWSLPERGSCCLDAGASPGGWTWVLHCLGAQVCAIDRSPLADFLMHSPMVSFIRHDAFTLCPESLGRQDWVFSDVICYPPRLLAWVERWRASGLCSKFVCTIKMQGMPDFDTIQRFAHIPHSKIVHLTANKHELTWLCAPFIDPDGVC